MDRLARYRRQFDVTGYAYCLMSNHVHLIAVSQVPVVQNVPIVPTGQDDEKQASGKRRQ